MALKRKAYLNQVLALGLGDQWLELGSSECIDKAGFGDDQKKHLSASQNGKLVCLSNPIVSHLNQTIQEASTGEPRPRVSDATHLLHDTSLSLGERNVPTRLILNKLDLDLATLTAGLVIIVIFIVGAQTIALGTTTISAVAGEVIVTRRKLFVDNCRHLGNREKPEQIMMWVGGG